MRRPLALLLVVALFGAAPAFAATALETARQSAQSARAKVNGIRAQQMKLRGELGQVASRIEELKAEQKGALLPGSELDVALRHSQELSASLTSAAQDMSSAESALEQENLALLNVLNDELSRVKSQWDTTTDRAARQGLIQKMRALRDEREQVRAALPASRVPALQTQGGDDPEDLLEQADALRDSEDKVRQKMKALQSRITELREERDLDRRMNDFMGDESMFDEQDRRLRKERTRDMASDRSPGLFAGSQEAGQADMGAGAPTGSGSFNNTPPPDQSRNTTLDPPAVLTTQIARGVDARPQVSGSVDALLLSGADAENPEALEAQLKKLKQLAQELDQRAGQLEQKAKELQ